MQPPVGGDQQVARLDALSGAFGVVQDPIGKDNGSQKKTLLLGRRRVGVIVILRSLRRYDPDQVPRVEDWWSSSQPGFNGLPVQVSCNVEKYKVRGEGLSSLGRR
jgi:hypothetical protein